MLVTPQLDSVIDAALTEDLGLGDVTTDALIPPGQRGQGRVLTRESFVVAGLKVFTRVFARLDPAVTVTVTVADGDQVEVGAELLRLDGPMASILTGERVGLNFLQRLSGIATLTRRYVEALPADCPTVVVDTRKTTPGLRALERQAVRSGGACNHRPRLDGGVLIKDNHIAACGSVTEAVRRAHQALGPALRVEVEVTTLGELDEALAAGAEVVMLDNMDLELLRQAVERIDRRALIEVSGGVRAEQVGAIGALGVDYISVGALTHSARAIDLSLELEPC